MMDLYPHQQTALGKLSNGKILWGGVGTGKSLVAMAYYTQQETPKDVYVITTAKKRDSLDWEAEGVRLGVGTKRDATRHGVLTVDSWNNIGKYEEVKDAFFIFDEQRLVGAGAWTKSFIKIAKQNNWILLSATPGDTWLDYIPVFVANGYYKNRTEFKREHVVYNHYSKFPKVDHYVGVGKLLRLRDHILVGMPYERHTTRHNHTIFVDHDEDLFKKVVKERWHVYENRPIRDISELFRVMRKVVNSHESRLSEIRGLMEKHPKLIVFYNFDYELKILRSLSERSTVSGKRSDTWMSPESIHSLGEGPTHQSRKKYYSASDAAIEPILGAAQTPTRESFAIAEWNGHKHEPIPEGDRWVYLVQYAAGAEGWNCVETDAMVFYSLTYSYKNFHQAHGRIDRLNTEFVDLHYYTLLSKSLIDRAVMGALRKKKSFNESRFSKSM